MYAGDLARVIQLVVENDVSESFNVAPPDQNYSIDEMARMSLQALGKRGWSIDYNAAMPDGQYRKDVSCEKMTNSLGEIEFTSFKAGVKKVYETLRGLEE
jgi:nucleoside-diphosphate-sugar epimerase